MVPFSAFTTVEQRLGTELLPKYNTYSAASLSGSAAPGYSSGQALTVMQQVFEQELGNTFGYEWTGLAYQRECGIDHDDDFHTRHSRGFPHSRCPI